MDDVAERAASAVLHAGAADVEEISNTVPGPRVVARWKEYARRLQPVADGAEVLGMRVVATPGDTRRHRGVDVDSAVRRCW